MFPTTNCAGHAAGTMYDDKKWGGLSDYDWLQSIQAGKPSVVIDRKRLYLNNPSVTDSSLWADSTKRFDWNTKKCKRI